MLKLIRRIHGYLDNSPVTIKKLKRNVPAGINITTASNLLGVLLFFLKTRINPNIIRLMTVKSVQREYNNEVFNTVNVNAIAKVLISIEVSK